MAMSGLATSLDVDTSILESLDFTFEPPCESPGHGVPRYYINGNGYKGHDDGGPAQFLVESTCPKCFKLRSVLSCKIRAAQIRAFQQLEQKIVCTDCNYSGPFSEFSFKITDLPR